MRGGWSLNVALLAAIVLPTGLAPAAPPVAKTASKSAPPPKASAPKPLPPPPPLALLPSIARVKVTDLGHVLAIAEEINLPRGEWGGESLRFYVAFGAPGPRAIDARLLSVGDGELEVEDDERGEVLSTERVPRRPPNAHALLGHDSMAGIVIVVPAEAFTKALARGNMATLRIRSLIDVTEDTTGAQSVVVRLGASRGTPLTLGRITAMSPDKPLARVEAKLCGADADPQPLAVELLPKTAPSTRGTAIAPVLAVRHATDDLCVRLWQAAPKPR